MDNQRSAMAKIDKFRESLRRRKIEIDVQKLVEKNKKELQERTDKLSRIS